MRVYLFSLVIACRNLFDNSGFVGPPIRPVIVSKMSKILPTPLGPPVFKLNLAVLLYIDIFPTWYARPSPAKKTPGG